MPRKLHLENHLSTADLKNRYLRCCDPVELRRWHLIWLVSDGWTLTEAAGIVALSYHYAREIIQNYNQQGIEGIRRRRKRPCQNLTSR
jgi:transposase